MSKTIFWIGLWASFSLQALEPYQDIFIKGYTVVHGSNICPERFSLIKPILDKYHGEFSVLDIGAAQGYFSFRIAHEYPNSICTMIEGGNVYKSMSDIIYKLLLLNDHLKNINLIDKHIGLEDIKSINTHSHYDIVLAFLVLHQMREPIDELMVEILKLGDNIIIEVSDDVCPEIWQYIASISNRYECDYLGEIKRLHSPDALGKGHFFNFKMH